MAWKVYRSPFIVLEGEVGVTNRKLPTLQFGSNNNILVCLITRANNYEHEHWNLSMNIIPIDVTIGCKCAD